ncbi:MAG: hypothetical protein WDM77_20610 [Steroidobacteraceae bacterium]
MATRREFLEAAAISALPAIAGARQCVDGKRALAALAIAPRIVLIDPRFAEARTIGACMAARGAAVHATAEGDVTQVWLKQVGPAWRHQPVTVAGITARPALFCLEQFALSCGLRVVFHGEHVVHQEGRTEHQLLRGPDPRRLAAHDLALSGRFWPALIAETLATYPWQSGHARFGRSDAALSPALPPDAHLLTSWIIAAA